MIIREIFENEIERHIDPVVEIGGETDDSRKEELTEFVVTQQASEHFKEFFKYYTTTSRTGRGDVGVWISGFFGSGKSHFMKMLAYILQNETIGGKKPLEYFENKVKDNLTIFHELTQVYNYNFHNLYIYLTFLSLYQSNEYYNPMELIQLKFCLLE